MTTPANTLIAEFRAAADEIETLLAPGACTIVAAQTWIVIDDFAPLTFTVTTEGRTHRATCTGHGRIVRAHRDPVAGESFRRAAAARPLNPSSMYC
ncbi:hypothetical protein [Nioella halotolerans]|uniref:hypothetical protein n=1 Tax=Nioella halotolerans TaxID=2303578 RepID=UPI00268E60DD